MTGVSAMTTRTRGRKCQTRSARMAGRQPFCVNCLEQGRHRVATETDHIVALVNGGSDNEENLQRLCADCHKDKTAVDMGREPRQRIGVDGWPIRD